MQEIAKFNNLKVRINYIDGEPYFVAKDICDALFITNVSQALSDLDEDEKLKIATIILNDTSKATQKTQSVWHVSESGVYSLLLKSRKKEAKTFRKWVTSEVLPTIRKTGSYSLKERSQEWLDKRKQSLDIRKSETEVINQFVKYAIEQGASVKGCNMYYSTFTTEIYKTLDIQKGERDKISGLKLYSLGLLEMTITNSLVKSMNNKVHYKECYKQAKQDFLQVAKLAGFEANSKFYKLEA